MSSPEKMKTGIGSVPDSNYFLPESFYIIYLILIGILRKNGYKDCMLYCAHQDLIFDHDMFDSGVIFNLFSDYGVGKELEPLLSELLRTGGLDPDLHLNNIFFQEIVSLVPEVSRIIRSHDIALETDWIYNYAMSYFPTLTDTERQNRLNPIIVDCEGYCVFCNEFEKYHQPSPDRNIIEIINQVVQKIFNNLN